MPLSTEQVVLPGLFDDQTVNPSDCNIPPIENRTPQAIANEEAYPATSTVHNSCSTVVNEPVTSTFLRLARASDNEMQQPNSFDFTSQARAPAKPISTVYVDCIDLSHIIDSDAETLEPNVCRTSSSRSPAKPIPTVYVDSINLSHIIDSDEEILEPKVHHKIDMANFDSNKTAMNQKKTKSWVESHAGNFPLHDSVNPNRTQHPNLSKSLVNDKMLPLTHKFSISNLASLSNNILPSAGSSNFVGGFSQNLMNKVMNSNSCSVANNPLPSSSACTADVFSIDELLQLHNLSVRENSPTQLPPYSSIKHNVAMPRSRHYSMAIP